MRRSFLSRTQPLPRTPQQKEFVLAGLPPVPVVEGGRGEDHGEFVDPLSGIAPAPLGLIPEVAPRQKAHHPLREALPHHESKVHLGRYVSEV